MGPDPRGIHQGARYSCRIFDACGAAFGPMAFAPYYMAATDQSPEHHRTLATQEPSIHADDPGVGPELVSSQLAQATLAASLSPVLIRAQTVLAMRAASAIATSFTGLRCSMFHSQSSPAGLWLRAVICAKAPKIEQPSELPMVAPPVRATVGDAVAHPGYFPQLFVATAGMGLWRQSDRHAEGVLSARRCHVTGRLEV